MPGNFIYSPTNGTVLNKGTNTLSVYLRRAMRQTTLKANGNVSLVVLPALLSVTASNASRVFGQSNPAFVGAITGLQNTDNITANYSCIASTNSPVGAYAIVPTLVDPSNRQTNYAVSLVNGALTVTQALPVISWTNPVAVTYGTALSSNQLNAAANVAGSFVYSPTNGTVLNAGTNALSVTFTPRRHGGLQPRQREV